MDIRKTEGQKQYKEEVVQGGEVEDEDDERWKQERKWENEGQTREGTWGEGRVGREGKGCQSKGKRKMRGRWKPRRDDGERREREWS